MWNRIAYYLIIGLMITSPVLHGQVCGDNTLINPGFEEVTPPCGLVPANGLINGSFNLGCMPGWEAAWGTPSVCAFGPHTGDYFACFGANNEGIHQNLDDLCTEGMYLFSFYYRRLSGSSGNMDVYFANGLVNQGMGNTGNPPLAIQPGWGLIVQQNVNNNAWQQYVDNNLQISNPANNQLLFVLSGPVDIGIDDVVLELRTAVPVISCSSDEPGAYTFGGSLVDPPPGYNVLSWNWDFGDGSSGSGQSVSHTFTNQGTYEVCLTITDACGCSITSCETIHYDACSCACERDEEPPFFLQTIDQNIQVSCLSEVPPPAVLVGADACDPNPVVSFTETAGGDACDFTISRVWTLTDQCGLSTQVTQTIRVLDDVPPQFIGLPQNTIVQCPLTPAFFNEWIAGNGDGVAQDNCSDVTWTAHFDSIPLFPCSGVEVTFTIADACDNSDMWKVLFQVEDNVFPAVQQFPEDLILVCPSNLSDTLAFWLENNGGGLAVDNCGPVFWSNDFSGDSLQQPLTVVFSVNDQCGNIVNIPASFVALDDSDTLYQTMFTCDSIAVEQDTSIQLQGTCEIVTITSTQLSQADTFRIFENTCDLLLAGIDTLFLQNQAGCDSIIITNRQYAGMDTTRFYFTTCEPGQAGVDTTILVNQFDCDSIIISETILTPAYVEESEMVLCGFGSDYSDTLLITGQPCDSILITFFRYKNSDTLFLAGVTCNPASAGVFVDNLTDVDGCDSVVVRTVHLLPGSFEMQEFTTCQFNEAGVDTLLLVNQFGCDSTVVHVTEYAGVDTVFVTSFSCDSAQVGVVTINLPGPQCDTVTVVTTMWSAESISFEVVVSCELAGPSADTLYFIGSTGCDSLHIRQFMYSPLNATFSVQHESCAGDSDGVLRIESASGGQTPYKYRIAGGQWQVGPEFTDRPPGTYSLELEDANGCFLALPAIDILPGPAVMISLGPDVTVDLGDFVELAVQPVQGLNGIGWTAVDPLSCSTCPQTTLGPVQTSQLVQVFALDDTGCRGIASMQVSLRSTELGIPRVYIPNSFSPNFDGINDLFNIYGNEEVLSIKSLAIFDRWGNEIFRREEMPINDPSEGWDGTFRGKLMDPAVFVYIAELVLASGEIRLYKGYVTLIR